MQLRESLKKQKTSKILVIANYVILILLISITALTIVQNIYLKEGFNILKE